MADEVDEEAAVRQWLKEHHPGFPISSLVRFGPFWRADSAAQFAHVGIDPDGSVRGSVTTKFEYC